MSTAYHPQTDGLAERTIMTLEDMLRRFCAWETNFVTPQGYSHDWVTLLPALQYAYNASVHSVTGKAPYHLERGYIPRSPRLLLLENARPSVVPFNINAAHFSQMLSEARDQAQDAISEAFDAAKKRFDAKHVPAPFSVGDEVMISTRYWRTKGGQKLNEPFAGPFAILKFAKNNNAIHVALRPPYDAKHPVFPVSLCKLHKRAPAESFPGRRKPAPPAPAFIQDGEAHYEVDTILRSRISRAAARKGKREYYVKWMGYDDTENSWETEDALAGAQDALRAFRASERSQA